MRAKKYSCPVEFTIDRIGGKWKSVILWWLKRGRKRFGELMQLMPEISQKVLTAQLRELEADDLIERHTFAESPPRVEYSLTTYGKTLLPIMELMCEWGKANAGKHQFESNCLLRLNILVIGNELFNQRMEGELGELRGANVITISKAIAIQDFEQNRTDIVLIDFGKEDDFSKLHYLNSQLAKPFPMIAIIENELDSDRAFDQGFINHLIEPVEISELVRAIANLTKTTVSK